MMKIRIITYVISCFFLMNCSLQKDVQLKSLTKEKLDELNADGNQIKCEQYIKGTMKYKSIEDIENGKLNKLKREAKKCGCNTVFLDFNNYLGADDELDFLFSAICINEKK